MNRYEQFVEDLETYAKDKRRSEFSRSLFEQSETFIKELVVGKQIKAHWEIERGESHTTARCSECGTNYYYFSRGQYQIDKSNYCPSCGADMRPPEEAERWRG